MGDKPETTTWFYASHNTGIEPIEVVDKSESAKLLTIFYEGRRLVASKRDKKGCYWKTWADAYSYLHFRWMSEIREASDIIGKASSKLIYLQKAGKEQPPDPTLLDTFEEIMGELPRCTCGEFIDSHNDYCTLHAIFTPQELENAKKVIKEAQLRLARASEQC